MGHTKRWMRRAGWYSTKGDLLIRQPTSGCHLPRWGRHARSAQPRADPAGEGYLVRRVHLLDKPHLALRAIPRSAKAEGRRTYEVA